MSETAEKPRFKDVLQGTWPVLFQTFKVINNKERYRRCGRQMRLIYDH